MLLLLNLTLCCALAIGCSDDDDSPSGNNNASEECQGQMTALVVSPSGSSAFEASQASGTSSSRTSFLATDADNTIIIGVTIYKNIDDIVVGASYPIQDISEIPDNERQAGGQVTVSDGAKMFNSLSGTVRITEIRDKPGSAAGQLKIVLLSGTVSMITASNTDESNTREITNGVFTEVLIATSD